MNFVMCMRGRESDEQDERDRRCQRRIGAGEAWRFRVAHRLPWRGGPVIRTARRAAARGLHRLSLPPYGSRLSPGSGPSSCFVFALEPHVGLADLIGRLDPSSEPYPYAVPSSVSFVGLPVLPQPRRVPRAAVGGAAARRGRGLAGARPRGCGLGAGPESDVDRDRDDGPAAREESRARRASGQPRVRASPPPRPARVLAGGRPHAGRLQGARAPVPGRGRRRRPRGAVSGRPASCAQFHVSLVAEADVRSEDPPERGGVRAPHPDHGRPPRLRRRTRSCSPLLMAHAGEGPDARAAAGTSTSTARARWSGELARRIAELGLQDVIALRGYVADRRGASGGVRARRRVRARLVDGRDAAGAASRRSPRGCPTVATDVGGVAALAGDAALLVAPGDAQAAADALRRLAEDEGLRTRLVEAGTVIARAHTKEAEAALLAAFLTGSRRNDRRRERADAGAQRGAPHRGHRRDDAEASASTASSSSSSPTAGSTDRTRAILEDLARDEQRIRVVDNPAGQTAAGPERRTARSPREHRRAHGCAHALSARLPRARCRTAAPW